jgi:fumarate reductase flavoprotein subunit
MFAVESGPQKRLFIDVTKDEMFRTLMAYTHWKANPRIVRAFIDKSADTIHWLEGMGLQFEVRRGYPGQEQAVYHVPNGEGAAFVKTLMKKCDDLGVRTFCGTGALKILFDGAGRVAGVVAGSGEKEIEITARCAIIATGGYAGNKELLKKYYPFYSDTFHVMGLPHMGDGLRMALESGAATEDLGVMHTGGPCFPAFGNLSGVSREPNTLWVNKRGERFFDERFGYFWPESGNALDRQPDGISYTLIDEALKRSFVEEGVVRGAGAGVGPAGTKMTKLPAELEDQSKKGTVGIADSWDGIARWMGADPQVLKSTVETYNRFCDERHDAEFGKDPRLLVALRTPPYYAIRCVQVTHNTLGGIKINHHMEVVNQQNQPIPGLYAVGVDTGGWSSDTYCFALTGNAFAFAVSSGRIAAEDAVSYISRA